ncbi:urease accessory protein UreF [Nonomuraea cypriaca]|uniref:urease accessory protein UreF n=1 Tax=Nonomuraea cypriaca TaxID=1187855 RepID=UPI0022A85653|nr:urease accessory UreF family protein [Nonomuraea cypriaca]
MNPGLLLLTDSRLPAGGHAHSGTTEQAITSGAVHDVPSLAAFLRGRLHTTGTVAAALTAAACAAAGTRDRAGADRTQPAGTTGGTNYASTGGARSGGMNGSGTGGGSTSGSGSGSTNDSGTNGGRTGDSRTSSLSNDSRTNDGGTSSRSTNDGRTNDGGTGGGGTGGGGTGGGGTGGGGSDVDSAGAGGGAGGEARNWLRLDAEVDARTASPAQRDASRTQGRLLIRVARRVWPSAVLDELAAAVPNPHHPIALGAAAHAAGATPGEAALAAAYHAISGAATAAVRLLGLDPVAVHGLLADLAPDLDAVASQAWPTTGTPPDTEAWPATSAPHTETRPDTGTRTDTETRPDTGTRVDTETRPGTGTRVDAWPGTGTPPHAARWAALPAYSAPALDLLAERHALAEVRLFVS